MCVVVDVAACVRVGNEKRPWLLLILLLLLLLLQSLQPLLAAPHQRLVAQTQSVEPREEGPRPLGVDGRVGRASRRKDDVGQHDARAAVRRTAGSHW